MEYKITGSSVTLSTTPSSIAGANLVRIYAPTGATITHKTAAAVTIGTMVVGSGSETVLIKDFTDTLEATATVNCTPVAYR
jgi:hypothetical protein